MAENKDLRLYKSMYLHLFNAVTNALEALEAGRTERTKLLLIRAQQECEEMFIVGPEINLYTNESKN